MNMVAGMQEIWIRKYTDTVPREDCCCCADEVQRAKLVTYIAER